MNITNTSNTRSSAEENIPVIIVKSLTKKYDQNIVLENLNFKIYKNKITTILGFSGAGKSTLLKHLLGLIIPTSGSINILGQDLFKLSQYQLGQFRKNFGMVFQYAALFDSMSAFENVAFPMREFSDMSDEQIKTRVFDLFESVGLNKNSYGRMPSQISGGMAKRVGIARALALAPKVMLYDEPTTGLDPITTRMVNSLIKETANENKVRGLTSVIISHDIKASLEISDFIAFLDHGRIIEYLPTEEFKKSQNETIQQFLQY